MTFEQAKEKIEGLLKENEETKSLSVQLMTLSRCQQILSKADYSIHKTCDYSLMLGDLFLKLCQKVQALENDKVWQDHDARHA